MAISIPRVRDLIQIPELERVRSLLCVQPHPDDNDIGCGGTVARLAASGVDVYYLTVTDGRSGTYDPELAPSALAAIRRREQEEAAAILGVKETHWLNFPDAPGLEIDPVRERVTEMLRVLRPEAVLAPDPWLPYEAHSHHRLTGLAVAEACLLAGLPHYYPSHREKGLAPYKVGVIAFYLTARPNTFVDVTDVWPKKMEALARHRSQFSADEMEGLAAFLTARAREAAEGEEFELAEAFKTLSPTHLHIFVDAELC